MRACAFLQVSLPDVVHSGPLPCQCRRWYVAVCTHLAVAAPPPPELAEMTFVIITT